MATILPGTRRPQVIPKSFALYGKILNAYNRIGMLPLKWTGGQMRAAESSRNWLVIKTTLIWLNLAFLDVQSARIWFADGKTLDKLYFTLQASVYSATAVNFSILIFHPQLIAKMINNLLDVQRRHDEIGLKDNGTGPRRVLKVTLFLCIFAPLSFMAKLLKDPNNPRSLISLTLNPTETAAQWKVICCFYQLYSVFATSTTLWLTVSTVTVFLRTLTRVITAIKKMGNEDLTKAINETTLLLVWFNSIFKHWTSVWEATFIWVLVVDLTVAVKQQSIRALLVAGCIATMMKYLYKSMGAIYEKSRDIMNGALPRARNASWFKRKCRAYRALRVNAGSFYFVDKGLILTMLSITIQYTANLILTIREA